MASTWRKRGRLTVVAAVALTSTAFATPSFASETPAPEASGEQAAPEEPAVDPVATTDWGDVTARVEDRSVDADGDWVAPRDAGSMHTLTANEGVQDVWAEGITGRGVTVAVLDTGVAPVQGLAGPRLHNGPDLSFDSQDPETRYVDGFGHGTHMAGITAGRDAGFDPTAPDPTVFAGVAPDAGVLNMKVGAGDGGVDVSQVIAALNWIVEHRDAGGMNVRVISLAYGTTSVQPWQEDPLARAVEDAWRAGIVVVAAAGNDGLETDRLLMPAVDPHILAVGAVDPKGNNDPADDVVADFTNGGSDARRPDVLAPGRSVVSLRVLGSFADTFHPEGRVEGEGTERFFRGSGTSQATAFAAGQVALLLQARPELTPDEVKAVLMDTARPIADGNPAQGAGAIDITAATDAPVPAEAGSSLPFSTGLGSLEASRGGAHVIDPANGVALEGEVDIQGQPWDAAAWAADSADGTTWQGGDWNGRTWTGSGFTAQSWDAAQWSGLSWSGIAWGEYDTSGTWEGRSWRHENWEGRSWRDDSWEGRSWRGRSWR